MDRPDDATFRVFVALCVRLRQLLPVAILTGSLVGPMLFVDAQEAMWLSPALFVASLFVLRAVAGLPLYPAHTFGIEYRYEDDPLEEIEGVRRCARCESVIDDGVRRRYARQIVVLGIPLYTLGWGRNDFCWDCIEAEYSARRTGTPHGSRRRRETGGDTGPTAGADASESTPEPATDPAGESTPTVDPSASVDEPDTLRERDDPVTEIVRRVDPGTELARRVDRHDETTALEVRRAFEDDDT